LLEVGPNAVRLNGADVLTIQFRDTAIYLPTARGRAPSSPELEAALASARAAGATQLHLLADRRTSMSAVELIGAAAKTAGFGPPVWVLQGPDGGAWQWTPELGGGCPEAAAPNLAASGVEVGRGKQKRTVKPHRMHVAPAALLGNCDPAGTAKVLTGALGALASCEVAAVEATPLLRDELDRASIGLVLNPAGEPSGFFVESRFAGADRALVPCLLNAVRPLRFPAASGKCLLHLPLHFQAGNDPESPLDLATPETVTVQRLPTPLTWARLDSRRRGLTVELGHAGNDQGCPVAQNLYARLEDPTPSTLATWLLDMLGPEGLRMSRVDLRAEAAAPVGDVLDKLPHLLRGARQARVTLSPTPQ
jgi:hypothetical protein